MRTMDDAFRASIAIDARLYKASFGGDRSEAGRYAANIRWQGNTKDPQSEKGGGGARVEQLLGGTPQNYEMKGVITVHGYDLLRDRGDYDDGAILNTTTAEFRKLIKDGSLDLSPKYQKHYLGLLEDKKGGAKLSVYLGVDAVPVRIQPIQPVRPDEPHTELDVNNIRYNNSSAAITEGEESAVGTDNSELALHVNTSPKNQGPTKAATLRRWEKAWTSDLNTWEPYCGEIAKHAAYQMGELKTSPPTRDTEGGFRTPPAERLAQDATDLLTSINMGQEAQPVLWRGITAAGSKVKASVASAKVGDTFKIGLGATSRDALSAIKYADDKTKVLLEIAAGSKGVDVARGSAVYVHDQEVITSGRFVVTGVEKVTVPAWRVPSLGNSGVSPKTKVALMREAIKKLESLVPAKEIAKLVKQVAKEERVARTEEAKKVTIKVISVRQEATFNPNTEEYEPND